MVLWLVLAAALPIVMPSQDREEAAARAWIVQAGHPFDPGAFDASVLSPLVLKLSDARIVGIGEATHGTHQDQAFKAELIKAMVKSGEVSTIILECNRAAGNGFDRYVRFGESDPVALMNSPSSFRIFRNDVFAGLLIWLRAWNIASVGSQIRIIGIDDQDSGRDASLALAFLASKDPAAEARLRAAMASLPTSAKQVSVWAAGSNRAEFDRADQALGELEALMDSRTDWHADPAYHEARYAARVARQGLRVFDQEVGDVPAATASAEYYSRRDRFMATNVVERVGDDKAVLWAHDDHVTSDLPDRFRALNYTSLGMELHRSYGAKYRTVGFTYSTAGIAASSGDFSSTAKRASERTVTVLKEPNNRPGELGSVFDPLRANALWLDLTSRPRTPILDRWAARSYWRGWTGWAVDPKTWQTAKPGTGEDGTQPVGVGFDVLVWFRTMTPAQTLPKAAN